MGLKEKQYIAIREKLDNLGYRQPLSLDSVLLVENLISDLEHLQKQSTHYKHSAAQANAKCSGLEQAVIPFRKDNEHLLKENNELHRIIINERDEAEKTIREMKSQLLETESAYASLEFAYMEQLASIGELHQDILLKNEKLLELDSSFKVGTSKKKDLAQNKSKQSSQKSSNQKQLQKRIKVNLKTINSVNNYISSVLDGKSKPEILEEIEKLRKDNSSLLNAIEHNKHQIKMRDQEINRLSDMLEKKSPIIVQHNSTCNCHCGDSTLFYENNDILLKKQLEEALEKQADAMKKAADLMERVKVLENEVRTSSFEKSCYCSQQLEENQREYSRCLKNLQYMESEKKSLQETLNKLKNEFNNLKRNFASLSAENEKLRQEAGREPSTISDCGHHFSKSSTKTCTSAKYQKSCCCACCSCYCGQKHSQSKDVSSDSEDSDNPFCSHENVLKALNQERKEATEELKKIQDELAEYKNKIAGISHAKHNEKCNNEIIKLQFQDKIKSIELEKNSLNNKLSSCVSKLHNAEQQINQMALEVEELTTECANWKAKYNHIKVLNEHLEMTINNSERVGKTKEADIKVSVSKIKELENEKVTLENELLSVRKERNNLRNNIYLLDQEKDSLLGTLDEKAIQLSKIEGTLKQKNGRINGLQNEISDLQSKLQTFERLLFSSENKTRSSNKDIRKLEAEITTLESCKESLLLENRRLQNDLTAVTQDNMQLSEALDASKQEVENLKVRLQTYVEEVRRVDELLQIKENERAELLEQFKVLSTEASNLEMNNQSLEYESINAKKTLKQTSDRLQNLEWEVESKNSYVREMEGQVTDLTLRIEELHSKMSEKDNYESVLSNDLDAARNLCDSLEKQKQIFNQQIWELQQNEKTLKTHLDRLKEDNEHLQTSINQEKKNKETLEEVLASSRQEAMEKSFYSGNLKSEMGEIQQNMRSLEMKLTQLTEKLANCQRSCEEYKNENTKLKRELVNERFERTRGDDSLSFSTSL